MKKAIILPFLFVFLFTFSQGSRVAFTLSGNNITTSDSVTGLKLPLHLIFTEKFKGKNVTLLSEDEKQVLALNNSKFGAGNLSRDGETNLFYIVINADRTVSPGDEKINSDKFILQIDQTKFNLSLVGDQKANNLKNATKESLSKKYVAGYIYYDAIKLVELLNDKSDEKTIIEILKAYKAEKVDSQSNPYLYDVFKTVLSQNRIEAGAASPFLTNLGNTDVTYFVAGLAGFLAERTKEELNEAFFSKMKEQLNAYPELKTLFPKTASFLDAIETYSYATVIQVLKESFETDIQNLPDNLYNIKNLTRADCNKSLICADCKKEPDKCTECKKYTQCQTRLDNLNKFFESQDGRWIGLGMFALKDAIQSSNPAELLKSITESEELAGIKIFSQKNAKFADYNIASSIHLGNLLSQSLMSKDENQVWINLKELSELFRDEKTLKIFLGLLLAKDQMGDMKINFYNSSDSLITFESFLIKAYGKYKDNKPEIISLIKNSYAAFNSANNAVRKMITAMNKSVEADPQALFDYYRTFTHTVNLITHSGLLKAVTGKDLGTEYDKIEQFLDPAVDIAYLVESKKYSSTIYDVVLLLNNSNTPVFEKPVAQSFIKYGRLITTVANAQSPDEVKKALEASVLPVGSYSIKRNTTLSISLNSYVGAYWNYANNDDHIPALGLSAPVSFNFSWGICKTGNAGGFSLNLQFIDLGALVNYYLINGDTAALPNEFKVRLSNVFAPGINIGYNVPKTPLTLTWGVHYIPALYKVDQINGKNEFAPVDTWRCQFSILIDIPLMNLKVWDF